VCLLLTSVSSDGPGALFEAFCLHIFNGESESDSADFVCLQFNIFQHTLAVILLEKDSGGVHSPFGPCPMLYCKKLDDLF